MFNKIDKLELIGWLGMLLVLLAYVALIYSFKLFLVINIFGTFLLSVYSGLKKVLPLFVINVFIEVMLFYKLLLVAEVF